jgi:hypothetical protein
MKDDDDTLCYRSELEAAVKAAVEAEREKFIAFLRQMHDAYAMASHPPSGNKPTTVIYRPADLESLGLTHEDVVKLIKGQV